VDDGRKEQIRVPTNRKLSAVAKIIKFLNTFVAIDRELL